MPADTLIQAAFKHFNEGNLNQAEQICRKVIKKNPDNFNVLNLLGIIYYQKGNLDLSLHYFTKSIKSNPNNAETYSNLGTVCKEKGFYDEAIHYYRKALQINPHIALAYSNLGILFQAKKQFDAAEDTYRKAIQLDPRLHEAYYNLGTVFQNKGQFDEAANYYKKALEINPDLAEAYHGLGVILMECGRLSEASAHFRRALSINPRFIEAYSNLGNVCKEQGAISDAEFYYNCALQINPDFSTCHSNLLLLLNFSSRYTAEDILKKHLQFAKHYEESLLHSDISYLNEKDPDRRLRIGYVSPDFRRHSVAYFIEPILNAHDAEHFEIICYANVSEPDDVTECFRTYADQWRNIVGMNDEEVVEVIRKDQIDILVDLAGHTANNRMLVFARKPAPVQATWIGYPATTGLSAVDYKLVDAYTDPAGLTEQYYSEQLLRLPGCFLCYLPPKDSPEIEDLPALKRGYITFGSFNNFAKISPEIFKLWTMVLKAVPGSCLVLKSKSFADETLCKKVTDLFEQANIRKDRIKLLSLRPSVKEHLSFYNQIDIGLDTFPYAGATTTCEALWMGVPVITLAGSAHASRVGTSILSNAGLTDLIAKTNDEYIQIALNLSRDIGRLQLLRKSLRELMAHSPLTDAIGFTSTLEKCYRKTWHTWCKSV